MTPSGLLDASTPPLTAPSTRESALGARDEPTGRHHSIPESGVMPCSDRFYIPRLLRIETLYRIYECFEEELGSELERHRVVASLGGTTDTFPRRLVGPLFVSLSQKLHPERRTNFLRDVCRVLHEYEGTPRVLV